MLLSFDGMEPSQYMSLPQRNPYIVYMAYVPPINTGSHLLLFRKICMIISKTIINE